MSSSDLKKVLDVPRIVRVRIGDVDTEIEVRQIKVGQLAAAFEALAPLAHLFKNPGDINPRAVFFQHSEDMLNIVTTALKKPKGSYDELEIDDAINLFMTVLEVNLDFFIQRVLPSALQATAALGSVLKLGNKVRTGGPTPSSNSSPEATVSTTS